MARCRAARSRLAPHQRQGRHHARRDVAGGRIEQRAVVREWNLVEPEVRVVDVEGAEAAAAALHADQPVERTPDRLGLWRERIGARGAWPRRSPRCRRDRDRRRWRTERPSRRPGSRGRDTRQLPGSSSSCRGASQSSARSAAARGLGPRARPPAWPGRRGPCPRRATRRAGKRRPTGVCTSSFSSARLAVTRRGSSGG